MEFLAPWWLPGLLLVPAVFLWGLLAPRGRRVVVGSLMLWRRALGAGPAGRPSARVRLKSPLLWLDAALVLLLVLVCARPALHTSAPAQPVATVLVDRTAGMLAAGGANLPRYRLAADMLPVADEAVGAPVRVVGVPADAMDGAPAVATLAAVRALEFDGWRPILAAGDVWPEAIGEAARQPDRPVLVVTDVPPGVPLPPNVYIFACGAASRNAGLVRAATRIEGGRWWLLVSAEAAADAPGAFALRVEGDGRALAEVPGFIEPSKTASRVLAMPGDPPDELRVTLQGEPDGFPADNAAYLVLERARQVRALLVGDPGLYVRRALAAAEGVRMFEASGGGQEPLASADLVVAASAPIPTDWTGPAALVTPPEIPGRLKPTDETVAAEWQVAADHPLADAFYLAPPDISPVHRYELGADVRPLVGTREAPLIVTWTEGGAKRLAVLFPLDRQASDWPTLAGFPVFWSRALEWLVPSGRAPPVHTTCRPYSPVPGGEGLAPAEPGFYSVLRPRSAKPATQGEAESGSGAAAAAKDEGEAGARLGVSFIGSNESFQAGPMRNDSEAAAAAIRKAIAASSRALYRDLWPYLAALAVVALVLRAWAAR